MNVHLPAPHRKWPARLVNFVVVVVVLALAAATFVLSYSGVHAIALESGVSGRLARVYPATFDAVLVIACVAALTLREARWWARSYAWLVIIVVVAVAGAADAVHAMNVALPHRNMEGVVAAVPWVLALLGFSLMLTMLRQSRAQPPTTAAPASRRPRRRAARHATDQLSLPPALPMESPDELTRPPVPAPALPAATAADLPAATAPEPRATPEPPGQDTAAEPAAPDGHPPTLVVPALTEADRAPSPWQQDPAQDEAVAPEPPPAADVSPADLPAELAEVVAEVKAHPAESTREAPTAQSGSPSMEAATPEATAAKVNTEEAAPSASLTTEPEPAKAEATPAESGTAESGTAVAATAPGVRLWHTAEPDRTASAKTRVDYWDTDEEDAFNRVRATPIPPEDEEE